MNAQFNMVRYFTLLLFINCCNSLKFPDFPELDDIGPSASSDAQSQAVTELINRKIPGWSDKIIVKINPIIGPKFKDTFQLMTTDSKLILQGTSGVAASMGLYYYLTQYCGCHISWAGDQLSLPKRLPDITQPNGIKITSNDRFRYYQNVCTVSYSFVWWNWTRWEQEIDWMAMSGINMPLAFNGQEAIWQRVYTKMGFTNDVLGQHFGGPAFLAWARMGNMHGWGGPLSQNWHNYQVQLQHKILKRMRELGMIPVVPAFAGHVPENFNVVFPSAKVSKLSDWGNFNSTYCCTTLLDVSDPMFVQIGKAFIEEYTEEFGSDHLYNTDTFNEMTPSSGEPSYLAAAGKAVYNGLIAGDSKAIWVMQGWLFQSGFWTVDRAKALLTSVPIGRMIVLDLYSELSPVYSRFSSYFGQPFIWCMLHNFGGNDAMYGALDLVNKLPFEGRSFVNSTMIGTGLTPEGINQNDVIYEFMNENAWRSQPRDINAWIENYSTRRYGTVNFDTANAWKLLQGSVYNCSAFYKDHERQVIIDSKPSYRRPLKPFVWYDPEDVFSAWDHMVSAAQSSSVANNMLFRYDLVDVGRQALQDLAIKYYDDILISYNAKDLLSLKKNSSMLLDLFNDLDMLLGTDTHFLLGRWIADAKLLALTADEAKLYEFNARNQVTLWGPTGQISDYARKQWSGLVKGYYMKRWKLFVTRLMDSLEKGTEFVEEKFNEDVFTLVELPFQTESTVYSNVPIGDTVEISKQIHAKHRSMSKKFTSYFSGLKTSSMTLKFQSFSNAVEPWSYKYHQTEVKNTRFPASRSQFVKL